VIPNDLTEDDKDASTKARQGKRPPLNFKIYLNLFCISLDLDNFLTLKNANIFVFFSLNRNFALSLQPETMNN